jgi:hypothetical protein
MKVISTGMAQYGLNEDLKIASRIPVANITGERKFPTSVNYLIK